MNCKICNTDNPSCFTAKVLRKYDVAYFQCTNCGFLQTEEPYWLNEAYSSSINLSDTGIIKRNISVTNILTPIILFFYGKKNTYLDYAGGYGILTRMMRDKGYDFYTNDPYTPNLIAKGFDYEHTILDYKDQKIKMVTAIECFEHYVNPIKEIDKMLAISKNIYFTTRLLPTPRPMLDSWRYYGFSHGQHISLYTPKTLKFLANKFNLNIYSIGGTHHLLTEKKINNYLFYIIVILGKLGLMKWVSLFLKSKTDIDSENAGHKEGAI